MDDLHMLRLSGKTAERSFPRGPTWKTPPLALSAENEPRLQRIAQTGNEPHVWNDRHAPGTDELDAEGGTKKT